MRFSNDGEFFVFEYHKDKATMNVDSWIKGMIEKTQTDAPPGTTNHIAPKSVLEKEFTRVSMINLDISHIASTFAGEEVDNPAHKVAKEFMR